MLDPVELALVWAGRGVPAFPVGVSWDEEKGSTIKRPLCASPGYQLATTDPVGIRALFASTYERPGEVVGVGVVPGRAGYVVLDLDVHAADGISYAAEIGVPESPYWASTASGGVHRWFRKRAVEAVSNRAPEEWSGRIDVRSDNGYVVAAGTETPWGNWVEHGVFADLETIPEPLWLLLDHGSAAAASKWRAYDPERHDETVHPATVATHRVLVESFGVNPALSTYQTQEGYEPWLHVCRPGKSEGVSGSIGRVGAGGFNVFTSSWPPFVAGHVYSRDDLEAFADSIEEGETAESVRFHNRVGDRLEAMRVEDAARVLLRQEKLAAYSAGMTPLSGLVQIADYLGPVSVRWGIGDQVLWSVGEALTLLGKPGTGKSWVALQIVRALCGGEPVPGVTLAGTEPLGFPVAEVARVLYLAADRPKQLLRMMQRFFDGVEAARYVVWPGPAPVSLVGDPAEFITWCRTICPSVDVVVLDSLKDVVPGLSDEAVVFAYNQTRQTMLAAGIDVLEIHHPRKTSAALTAEDLFGSMMLSAGTGSVLAIDGVANGDEITLSHLKVPQSAVGPLKLTHDRENWMTTVGGFATVEAVLQAAGPDGMLVNAIAAALHGAEFTDNQRRIVAKRVARLVEQGLVDEVVEPSNGRRGRPPMRLFWAASRASDLYVDPLGHVPGPINTPQSAGPEKSPDSSGSDRPSEPESRTFADSDGHDADPNDFQGVENHPLEGMTLDEAGPDGEAAVFSGQYRIDSDGRLRWVD